MQRRSGQNRTEQQGEAGKFSPPHLVARVAPDVRSALRGDGADLEHQWVPGALVVAHRVLVAARGEEKKREGRGRDGMFNDQEQRRWYAERKVWLMDATTNRRSWSSHPWHAAGQEGRASQGRAVQSGWATRRQSKARLSYPPGAP